MSSQEVVDFVTFKANCSPFLMKYAVKFPLIMDLELGSLEKDRGFSNPPVQNFRAMLLGNGPF